MVGSPSTPQPDPWAEQCSQPLLLLPVLRASLLPAPLLSGVEKILLSHSFFSTGFVELRCVTVSRESTDFIGLEVKLLLP